MKIRSDVRAGAYTSIEQCQADANAWKGYAKLDGIVRQDRRMARGPTLSASAVCAAPHLLPALPDLSTDQQRGLHPGRVVPGC